MHPAEPGTTGMILRAIETAPVWVTALVGILIVALGSYSKGVQAWMDAKRSAGAATRKRRTEEEDLRLADMAIDLKYLREKVDELRGQVSHLTGEQERTFHLAQEHSRWDYHRIHQIYKLDPSAPVPAPPPLLPRSVAERHEPASGKPLPDQLVQDSKETP